MLLRPALVALLIGALSGVARSATPLWWDTGYSGRFNVAVGVGAIAPDKGYAGYTARIAAFNTQALVASGDLRADCADLRIAYYDGLGWQDLPRHVIGCNTTTTDVRFALAADIPAGSSDDNYYAYFGNPTPSPAAAVTETNVYLWFDDASIDRSGSYVRGRVDNWHGSGWDNSLVWNPAGYYSYDNGDNFTSGYRRGVDERDVYIEAEFFHTGCYQLNITTGLLVRGSTQGSSGNESSNSYYASNRGEYPGCTTNGYTHDGDIVVRNRPTTAVNGPNPPDVVPNTWRRQGLAVWQTSPNSLAFWDEDNSTAWSALGYPSNANLHVAGTHSSNVSSRGFAAVMTAQDRARLRNVLIRRYVQPEPQLTLTLDSPQPAIVLQKSLLTVSDPINNQNNPKAIPGAQIDYTITASNSGAGSADADSVVVTDPLPASVTLFVGNLSGGGPIEFIDGVGGAASGLALNFGSLADTTDDIEFSTNGVDYSYVPSPDAQGFDAAVRFVRVRPSGTFNPASGATAATFSLRFRVRVD